MNISTQSLFLHNTYPLNLQNPHPQPAGNVSLISFHRSQESLFFRLYQEHLEPSAAFASFNKVNRVGGGEMFLLVWLIESLWSESQSRMNIWYYIPHPSNKKDIFLDYIVSLSSSVYMPLYRWGKAAVPECKSCGILKQGWPWPVNTSHFHKRGED